MSEAANATAPAASKLTMASEPQADATLDVGRSIADHDEAADAGPNRADDTSAKQVVAIAPMADDTVHGGNAEAGPAHRYHRHRHHDRHAGLAYRQAWR